MKSSRYLTKIIYDGLERFPWLKLFACILRPSFWTNAQRALVIVLGWQSIFHPKQSGNNTCRVFIVYVISFPGSKSYVHSRIIHGNERHQGIAIITSLMKRIPTPICKRILHFHRQIGYFSALRNTSYKFMYFVFERFV